VTAAFARAFGDVARGGMVTGSDDGPMGQVSVPDEIAVEQSGFGTRDEAAKAFGDRYYSQGVGERAEYQTGVVALGKGNYGYVSPGAAPPGITRVDPSPLYNAIRAKGFSVVGWAHTHWDDNLIFSGADMQFVYRTRPNGVLYLTNAQGATSRLDYSMLRSAASGYRGANGILQYINAAKGIAGERVP